MTRKKIFHIIYFLLTVFVVFAIAQQSEFYLHELELEKSLLWKYQMLGLIVE